MAAAAAGAAVRAAMAETPKVKINKIASQSGYIDWLYQTSGEIEFLELEQIIATALIPGNPEPLLPLHAALTEVEEKRYRALGKELRSALEGDALRLCSGQRANSAVAILRVLNGAWGQEQAIDHHHILSNLGADKFKSGDLKLWISDKFSELIKIPMLVPDGPPRNAFMTNLLLNGMPEHFSTVCSELRSNIPANWQDVERRLLDFHKAKDPPKTEIQGKAYTTTTIMNVQAQSPAVDSTPSEIAALTKNIGALTEKVTALFSKGGKGGKGYKGHRKGGKGGGGTTQAVKCYRCGYLGHKRETCHVRLPNNKDRKNDRKNDTRKDRKN